MPSLVLFLTFKKQYDLCTVSYFSVWCDVELTVAWASIRVHVVHYIQVASLHHQINEFQNLLARSSNQIANYVGGEYDNSIFV